jgi:hypothetical protein
MRDLLCFLLRIFLRFIILVLCRSRCPAGLPYPVRLNRPDDLGEIVPP